MESTDLDMGEIFDDNDIDEDIGATGVLPDLEPTQSQDNDEDENAEVLARLKDLSKGAAKKIVRKPQPKLDPTRLTGERGIPILPNLFKDVKFKGKGHESHDLAVLMKKMEHWAHRLFPKMPFDEVVERVERLGSKKEVQTCIKKIRLDMPILTEDFVGSDQDNDDDDVVRRGDDDVVRHSDDEPGTSAQGEVRAEDMWDELLKEEAEISESQMETLPSNTAHTTSSQADYIATKIPTTPVHNVEKTKPDGMTPEMLERIERNKQLALEKRLKKMGHLTPGSKLGSSQLSSQTPTKMTTVNNLTPSPAQDKQTDVDNSKNITTADSVKTEQVSKVTTGDINTELSAAADDDNEMSEVIEKGPSQNISVKGGMKEDAQHWHTGAPVQSNSGIQLDTENMDTENTEIIDDCSNSVQISDQNADKCLQRLSQNSTDSQAMSEIIEPVENETIVLKEKPNNITSGKTDSKQMSVTNEKLDVTMSVDKLNTDSKIDKENKIKDQVDMTGDHCNMDHF
ncbi:probable serine/threonine-protein kinase kinX [Ruditapes philippinarum]|uniref:probable serine/threonine-protein kinase kinX n=1 Tax=Ruditapes philippinarum TaxID=129788 RepID=UPI00295A69E5|nr:probable serine/threonine-protein kinase kinX [Ruditapes philippinarum]